MEIREWWPSVTDATREWLLHNNGSPLPPQVSSDILTVGGPSTSLLPDADVDWIEAVANGETPD
jgi:hypothetical protein